MLLDMYACLWVWKFNFVRLCSEEIYTNETLNAIGFAVHFPNKNIAKKLLFEDPKD
jgi:hypothetical protein